MKAHERQNRRGSKLPYIVHPLEVASILTKYSPSPIGYCIALLHDVLEDTDMKPQEMIAKLVKGGVTPYDAKTITEGVESLTKRKGQDYNQKLRNAAYLPQLVKLCDIQANVSDPYGCTKDRLEKYIPKKMENLRMLDRVAQTPAFIDTFYTLQSIDTFYSLQEGTKNAG